MPTTRREIFRAVKDRLGWSIPQVAAAIGKSEKTVEGYLGNGRGTPTDEALDLLKKVYMKKVQEDIEFMGRWEKR